MSKLRAFSIALGCVTVLVVGMSAAPARAANRWPHTIVNGFANPSGGGYWLVYANGSVGPRGNATSFQDASALALAKPIVGGAVSPSGKGYWLVAQDGGIFTYGDARFHGSMGGKR